MKMFAKYIRFPVLLYLLTYCCTNWRIHCYDAAGTELQHVGVVRHITVDADE
jgi:hypothetical protein